MPTTGFSNDQTKHTPLKVLNASAGSGKTYNLVKEYLSLLLKEEHDTGKFSRIIAMTFTNKAALEMKNRIIKQLDELAYPKIYGEKSTSYAKNIGGELGLEPEKVHARALRILQAILHAYEDFQVMTIDKFNLKLIRSFSRDLDLPADFEVILNEKEVIEQVVDVLLDQLGKENVQTLTNLVFEYAKSNLDDGKRWDFRRQLIDFGSILSKEREQALVEKLLSMDFSLERYKLVGEDLRHRKSIFIDKCRQTYQVFQQTVADPSSLPGKSHSQKPLEKLAVLEDYDTDLFTDAFLRKANETTSKGEKFPEALSQAINALQAFYESSRVSYFILKKFRQDFYNMALLQYIANSLNSIKKSEQLIRISEFNQLISELVKNEEAPFIYERLGVRFQHFLLDEFQDTSRLQWLNMVPLVHESLSNQHNNLIVGDPKQSIYRFKNGVAEQFVTLPKIYNPENDPSIAQKSVYFDEMGIVRTLEENWRSSPVIVDFNNGFFQVLKEELPENSRDFYNSVRQEAKSDKAGYVKIVSREEEKDYDIIPELVSTIEACENDGFKRGDICLLSEKNDSANYWAIELSKRGYKIVSAESLLVHNELKVKLTISYLRRRLNPSSDNERKLFAELYFRVCHEDAFIRYQGYFESVPSTKNPEKTVRFFNDDRFLAENLGGKAAFFMHYEHLYDLIQEFYRLMKWNELKNPYLHHLADFIHEFELAKGPDLASLLDYYEEKKSSLAIQLPESDDAIRIMTIHKSKGLEFPVVILPLLSFNTEVNSQNKFLLEITDNTTDSDYILYTTISQKSPIEEISSFKNRESEQVLTDKINLCYVAFTRPEERLYVFNYFPKKKNFGTLAHACFNQLEHREENGTLIIEQGSTKRTSSSEKHTSTSFFEPENLTDRLWFPHISLQDQLELGEKNFLSDEQRFGNQFHLAMANILSPETVSETIRELVKTGEIEQHFAGEIEEKAKKLFQLEDFQQLFEQATEILNEQSLLVDEHTVLRPDKLIFKAGETIILDYKTGIPSEKDRKQVNAYMHVLRSMNLPGVKGYLFYTALGELREV